MTLPFPPKWPTWVLIRLAGTRAVRGVRLVPYLLALCMLTSRVLECMSLCVLAVEIDGIPNWLKSFMARLQLAHVPFSTVVRALPMTGSLVPLAVAKLLLIVIIGMFVWMSRDVVITVWKLSLYDI